MLALRVRLNQVNLKPKLQELREQSHLDSDRSKRVQCESLLKANLNIPAGSYHDCSSAPPGTRTHLQHAPQGPDPSHPAKTHTHALLPLDPPHAS